MSLSGIPELDGVVPASAYQLVRGFGVEASAEDSGFMTIHDIRRVTAFKNYRLSYRISIFATVLLRFSLSRDGEVSIREYFSSG